MCWIKQRGLEGTGWRRRDPDAPRGGGELSLKGLKGGDLGRRSRHVYSRCFGDGVEAGEGEGEKLPQKGTCQPLIQRSF